MSGPCLFVIGATHQNAPLEVRERLALSSEAAIRRRSGRGGGPEGARGPLHVQPRRVLRGGVRRHRGGIGPGRLLREAEVRPGRVREDQDPAHRQGRRAAPLRGRERARFPARRGERDLRAGEGGLRGRPGRRAPPGAVLNRLFQKAFQAAKHVRTSTGIASGPRERRERRRRPRGQHLREPRRGQGPRAGNGRDRRGDRAGVPEPGGGGPGRGRAAARAGRRGRRGARRRDGALRGARREHRPLRHRRVLDRRPHRRPRRRGHRGGHAQAPRPPASRDRPGPAAGRGGRRRPTCRTSSSTTWTTSRG